MRNIHASSSGSREEDFQVWYRFAALALTCSPPSGGYGQFIVDGFLSTTDQIIILSQTFDPGNVGSLPSDEIPPEVHRGRPGQFVLHFANMGSPEPVVSATCATSFHFSFSRAQNTNYPKVLRARLDTSRTECTLYTIRHEVPPLGICNI